MRSANSICKPRCKKNWHNFASGSNLATFFATRLAFSHAHYPYGGLSMSKIKLNLQRLTIPEKTARAQQIVAAMTGNAHFETRHPGLTQVRTVIDELNAAYLAAQT